MQLPALSDSWLPACPQEAGVDLVAILDEEGFYVRRRRLTSPPKPRVPGRPVAGGAAFGKAAPLEVRPDPRWRCSRTHDSSEKQLARSH
jgi:hypothetical protein